MLEIWGEYFSSSSFMPHGHCYLWKPEILWVQVISNSSIGLAYVAIAAALAYLVRKGQYVPFKGAALAFGVFIVTCGMTHFFDVYLIWDPVYWADSAVRSVTAVASVGTALMLPPLIPKAVALARGAKAARERGIELQEAFEGLGRLYEKTKELEELKTQFFANVSHELRTPLALILGPIEKLLSADNLTAEQRRDADLVLRNANTLLKHVNDLLDVSRLEAGRAELDYVKADLAALVHSVAAQFEGVARDRGIQYTVETPSSMESEIDRDKIQRVLLNLLSNAFKFTVAGCVRVTLILRSASEAVIQVADSGPGVRPEDREIVFERFRQMDGSQTRHFGGTGLGLTIVKDFIDLHQGSIGISGAPEGGALFEVVLPLRAPADSQVAAASNVPGAFDQAARQTLDELRSRVAVIAQSSAAGEAPLVLVVEDNADMNSFVCEVLAEEYRVESAFDGKEGLEKALKLRPDLLISDVMMPRMSGEQLVEAVREHSELEKLPILLLTAKADEDLRVRLLASGAQDYVTKPFAPRELKARAANLVTIKRVRDVLEREIEAQIGDLEQLAEEVTHRKREMHTALDAMRVAKVQAERASQLRTNFLGLVSHELRTPLAALQIQLERLQLTAEEHGLSETGHRLMARMQQSTKRLQGLIDALLEHARLNSGHFQIEPQAVDLRELAEDVLAELQPDAEEKKLDITLELQPDLPPLRSDARLVRLILHSLTSNAVKFTQKGSVAIAVKYSDGEHQLSVADTGPGIAEQERIRIFEPFEQLESLRGKHTPGIGLGLTLVRDLVAGLGGSLALESAVGAGSRFTVTLPSAGRADT